VLHVPHLGASTREAQAKVATAVVERVVASLKGDVPADAVVPVGGG
jgi:phosphoglycerate dehydrogenase-like enzyme